MALIRNFPVPSDRMAIISTLLNFEDAVVLEYGPEGTTHFSMNFFNKLGQDYPDRLFTTGVDDSDILWAVPSIWKEVFWSWMLYIHLRLFLC